jgi:hypothetical protein
MQPSTVLFLAANPAQVPLLQLGEECRAIEDKIRAAKFRDQIRFRSRWAARPDDLLQALNEDTPSVLHFSGHGAGDEGLYFQSEGGSALLVSADGLSQVMQAAGAGVMVVVLNACYSEVQAQALVAHVPCVVGMPDAIGDEAAIIYAASLYRALAFGKSVANAHQQGLAALALHSTGGQTRHVKLAEPPLREPIPKLLIRPDTDADRVYIVHARENPLEDHPSPGDEVPPPGGSMTRSRHRKWGIYKLLVAMLLFLTVSVAARAAIGWVQSSEPFGFVVRLHGPASRFDIVCTSGTVSLDIGTDRRIETITNDGEAYFTEIPQSFVNESVPIGVSCNGYAVEELTRITLEPDQTYYVLMREQCGNHHCDPGETHQACPGDCPVVTDAGVDAAAGVDATAGVDAAVGAKPVVSDPPRHRGPCTRTPGTILHQASSNCPKLTPTEPDARAIAHEEQAKGYTCTDIYRCK